MTRTVEQARLNPMKGDAWDNQYLGMFEVVETGTLIQIRLSDASTAWTTPDAFYSFVADAAPVRVFEGEG